jgi:hypothetical protein
MRSDSNHSQLGPELTSRWTSGGKVGPTMSFCESTPLRVGSNEWVRRHSAAGKPIRQSSDSLGPSWGALPSL